MILDNNVKNAINTVMSFLLPAAGVTSLDISDTYILRERVAAVQGEVEFFRIQVENHLANLNSRIQSSHTKQPSDSIESRLARLLSKKGLDLDTLLSDIDKKE